MNPIETLTALDGLRRELHCQQEKIACLEEAARYLSPAGDGIGSSSGPSDRVGKMAGQIADEKAELERMEERYSQAVAEAAGVLSGLADPVEREGLTKWYIAGKNWAEISGSMGYTHRNIRRLKQSAFQKLSANVR